MKSISFILLPFLLIAGTTGKIAGKVIDSDSNDDLIGVNIILPTLNTGAATDWDGYYFILNIPPGIYEIEASMIGYQAQIKQQVQVFADRTTTVNFELKSSIIEIETPIVVIAEKPIIEIDMTSKEARITKEDIDILPVETPENAIALQGGVTQDATGEIHIRGGRSGELAYYVDGIEVSNPLLGTTPVFHKNLISEMSLLSGTFNAEYGNIMSGVVNIVTPEGGNDLSAVLEYTSPRLIPSPYRKSDWMSVLDPTWTDAHRDTIDTLDQSAYTANTLDTEFIGEINGYLSTPMPFDRKTSVVLSGSYSNRVSDLPFGYDLIRTANSKITRRFPSNLKIFVDGHYARREYQNYSHLYKYIYYDYEDEVDHYLVNYVNNLRALAGINHAPTAVFFYNIRFGYIVDSIETKVPGLENDTIIEPSLDNYSEFYISGYPIYRQDVTTIQYVAKADLNLNIARIHNLKMGFEHSLYEFNVDKREQLFVRGPIAYQEYTRKPFDGAVFIQNKIEHKHLVANIGLRFDYADPAAVMWEDIEDPTSPLTDVAIQYQFSPRIGLSHPITDAAMFHFAYGHFFQRPPYEIMYFNSNYIAHPESIPRYGLVGNPRIKPQQTIAYEAGIKYAFRDLYAIDVTLFLKDIKNLLATTQVRTYPYDYIIYTNEDFGSVQGIDVSILRKLTSNVGFDINYTFQIARGNRSFPMQGFYDVYTGVPERMKEYYLDFDRRHTFSGTAKLTYHRLGGMTVSFTAASGLPYTPYISEGVVVEENSARMGWTYSIDALIYQGFDIGGVNVELYAKGTNLTDHLNPRYVYAQSGEPWDTGEPAGGLMGSMDYIMDPSHVGPRRTLKAGIRIAL
jgi:hypothetical protein